MLQSNVGLMQGWSGNCGIDKVLNEAHIFQFFSLMTSCSFFRLSFRPSQHLGIPTKARLPLKIFQPS